MNEKEPRWADSHLAAKATDAEQLTAAAEQVLHETVRVVRLIEYVGPRAAVANMMRQRGLKGELLVNGVILREAIIGDPWAPEVLK